MVVEVDFVAEAALERSLVLGRRNRVADILNGCLIFNLFVCACLLLQKTHVCLPCKQLAIGASGLRLHLILATAVCLSVVDSLMTSGERIGQLVTSPVPPQSASSVRVAIAAAKATTLTPFGQFLVTPCLPMPVDIETIRTKCSDRLTDCLPVFPATTMPDCGNYQRSQVDWQEILEADHSCVIIWICAMGDLWRFLTMELDGDKVKVDGHPKCDTIIFNMLFQDPRLPVDRSIPSGLLQDGSAA